MPLKAPQKPLNYQVRPREWLTAAEVGRLIQAVQSSSRYPERDTLMLFFIYTHGMRVIEITELLWEDVDFSKRLLLIRRAKRGMSCTHPLSQQELNALAGLKQSYEQRGWAAPWVFLTERTSDLKGGGVENFPHARFMQWSIGLAKKPDFPGLSTRKCCWHPVPDTWQREESRRLLFSSF